MELARALRELRPKKETIHRDVLMYRAGRASARSWFWPAATLFSTTAAFTLSISFWIRPAPSIMYVAAPPTQNDEVSTSPPSAPLVDDSERGAWSRYVQLQEQVILHGLDGLPRPPSGPEERSTDVESLLNSL
jgi:hypothetical protein